jgi:hypothetical protein
MRTDQARFRNRSALCYFRKTTRHWGLPDEAEISTPNADSLLSSPRRPCTNQKKGAFSHHSYIPQKNKRSTTSKKSFLTMLVKQQQKNRYQVCLCVDSIDITRDFFEWWRWRQHDGNLDKNRRRTFYQHMVLVRSSTFVMQSYGSTRRSKRC